MSNRERFAGYLATIVAGTVMSGCAATTIAVTPSPQSPVCDRDFSALVLWMPRWRPDQKDVPEREAAAAQGLQTFFDTSGCFARAEIRRVANGENGSIRAQATPGTGSDKTVFIAVRELGPVVRLLSSAALVEGSTQVVLDVTEYSPPASMNPREFSVSWQNGGPGVIKGVTSLPADMQAALNAALQPARPAK